MNQVSKVGVIAAMNLRRFVRDRSNLFFTFVLPVALILVVGMQFGGDPTPRLGVAGAEGATARAVIDQMGIDEIEIVMVEDPSTLADRVEATDLDAGVVFPAGIDAAVEAAEQTEIEFHSGSNPRGAQLQSKLQEALIRALAGPAATNRARELGADPEAVADAVARHGDLLDQITVTTSTTGDRLFPEGTEGFDVGAPSQMVLFVILTGLSGSYALILTRQLGLGTRMMTSPTSVTTIIVGEAVGRFVIGLVQGVYVLVATNILFGVSWGDPVGAAAVVVAVAAVAAGGAMCFGTFFANPESASGLGVVVALTVGALGGAMLPIELFSDTLASVARFTPHYWALDAFAELIRHDGTIADIVPQLGVMAAMAAALLLLASWRMRLVLTRGR